MIITKILHYGINWKSIYNSNYNDYSQNWMSVEKNVYVVGEEIKVNYNAVAQYPAPGTKNLPWIGIAASVKQNDGNYRDMWISFHRIRNTSGTVYLSKDCEEGVDKAEGGDNNPYRDLPAGNYKI